MKAIEVLRGFRLGELLAKQETRMILFGLLLQTMRCWCDSRQ